MYKARVYGAILRSIANEEAVHPNVILDDDSNSIVKLCRLWDRFINWTPTIYELQCLSRTRARIMRGFKDAGERALRIAFLIVLLYLAIEVAVAFLPGSAVDRVIGGVH